MHGGARPGEIEIRKKDSGTRQLGKNSPRPWCEEFVKRKKFNDGLFLKMADSRAQSFYILRRSQSSDQVKIFSREPEGRVTRERNAGVSLKLWARPAGNQTGEKCQRAPHNTDNGSIAA